MKKKHMSILELLSQKGIFISFIIVIFVTLSIISAVTYLRTSNCIFGSIRVNGSTALAPLIQDVAHDYEGRCPLTSITVNPSDLPAGSFAGMAEVQQGQINIGSSDVFADTPQIAHLEDHQVAVVVYALVVNNDVGITGLTTDQIRRIYSGDITNWQEVGSRKNMDIVRVSRPATSGTRATFEKYVLGGVETVAGPQALTDDTTEHVAKYVATQPGAIGYVSLYYAEKYARQYHLTTLAIDGHAPEASFIRSNVYPFWNIEHMYTQGSAQGLTRALIDDMYSNTAKHIAEQDAFLPISDVTSSMKARSSL